MMLYSLKSLKNLLFNIENLKNFLPSGRFICIFSMMLLQHTTQHVLHRQSFSYRCYIQIRVSLAVFMSTCVNMFMTWRAPSMTWRSFTWYKCIIDTWSCMDKYEIQVCQELWLRGFSVEKLWLKPSSIEICGFNRGVQEVTCGAAHYITSTQSHK